MPRELLRLTYPLVDLVLLSYPEGYYRIDVYWRAAHYYETAIETDSLDTARQAILKIAEQVLL